MTQTITVKNVARRPVDLEGGRVLGHGESATVADDERLQAQIAAGLLVQADGPAQTSETTATTNPGETA